MVLTDDLINNGFSLQDAGKDDLERYIDIKRACCKKYCETVHKK